jgi:rhomboid family GlyGly-CTERM serine protease
MLVMVAIALYLLFGPAPERLVFDRSAILQGEIWRVITGHWVHSDLEHAAWDITVFIMLGYLLVSSGQPQLYRCLLASMVIVSMYILLFMPGLELYCGLSGILNTMLVVVLRDIWLRYRHPVIPLIAAASLVKILVESGLGKAIFTDTAWQSVPEVHLVGFVVGIIFVVFDTNIKSNKKIEKQRQSEIYR